VKYFDRVPYPTIVKEGASGSPSSLSAEKASSALKEAQAKLADQGNPRGNRAMDDATVKFYLQHVWPLLVRYNTIYGMCSDHAQAF